MIRCVGKYQLGVLNNFDLATLRSDIHGHLLELIGTLPFTALELLSIEGVTGKITHGLKHDPEATFWVLVWVYLCLKEDGSENPPSCLVKWRQSDHQASALSKLNWRRKRSIWATGRQWASIDEVVEQFRHAHVELEDLVDQYNIAADNASRRGLPPPSPPPTMTDHETWIWYCDQLRKAKEFLPTGGKVAEIVEHFLLSASS